MVKLNPCKEIKLNEYVKFNYEIIVVEEVVGFIYGQTNVIGCHLSLIYVNDKNRNKGYGTEAIKLLKAICEYNKIKCIYGEALPEKQQFYEYLGAEFIIEKLYEENKLYTFFINF